MNIESRIASILKTSSLDVSITDLPTFNLSDLNISTDLDIKLPTNLRLGHLAEMIVGELIKSSSNYKVLYENVQLIIDKKTIGEIDFILSDLKTTQVIHMELAYKFYLFDPTISSEPINNWIGPNRNDSLIQKLEKVKSKQFPLLYHNCAQSMLTGIEIDNISQVLCLLASLYIPFEYSGSFSPNYEKSIKGYYLNIEKFVGLDHSDKEYYLPTKVEWGMDPFENQNWSDFFGVEENLNKSIMEKQAPLCWQKHKDSYSTFFVVWW